MDAKIIFLIPEYGMGTPQNQTGNGCAETPKTAYTTAPVNDDLTAVLQELLRRVPQSRASQ